MSEDWIGRPLDLLLGYEPGMTMPTVRGPEDRQWHPEDARTGVPGSVPARTASEDAWVTWRRKHVMALRWNDLTRRCNRQVADDARMLIARKTVRKLIETGRVDMSEIENTDAARAEDALTVLVSVVKNGAEATKDRIAAAKALLDFTRQKPASRTENTVKTITDWIDELPE